MSEQVWPRVDEELAGLRVRVGELLGRLQEEDLDCEVAQIQRRGWPWRDRGGDRVQRDGRTWMVRERVRALYLPKVLQWGDGHSGAYLEAQKRTNACVSADGRVWDVKFDQRRDVFEVPVQFDGALTRLDRHELGRVEQLLEDRLGQR